MAFKQIDGIACIRRKTGISFNCGYRLNFYGDLVHMVGDKMKNRYLTILEDDETNQVAFQLSAKPLSPNSVVSYKPTEHVSSLTFNVNGLLRYLGLEEGSHHTKMVSYMIEDGLIVVNKDSLIQSLTKDGILEIFQTKKKQELNKGRGLKAVRGVK